MIRRTQCRPLLSLLPLAAVASLPLAACSVPDSLNPVEWYRDATGLSKNDPGPEAPNTKNLEAGGQQDFPSLATVPPAPTQALSTEEREAMTQHLIADRANAKYTDEQLRVGPASAAAPPPAALAAAKPASAPQALAAATPAPAAESATPAAASPSAAPAQAPPAAAAEAPEAPPQESSLTSPEVQNLPQPEMPRAAPPPPPADLVAGGHAPAAPVSPAPAPPAPPAAAAPKPLPAPAAVAQAPAPAPTPPPAPAPAPAPARPPVQTASLPPPAAPPPTPAPAPAAAANPATPVAQITFANNSTRLSAADQRTLDEVVPMQQRSGGSVRVVGYASEGHGSGVSQQLASFKMALDRANAVAAALREAGIEPNRILVEAAPPTPETGVMAQRAEIFLVN